MQTRNYKMNEVAKLLAIEGIGLQNLYYYMKEFKIIKPNNVPNQEYITKGYLSLSYGTRNHKSKLLYHSTTFTETGLNWAFNEIRPRIIEAEEQYKRK